MDDALEIARDASSPAASLAALAGHRDPAVQAALAANPSTPVEALWLLGQRHPAALASNPLLPVLAMADPGALHALPADTIRALLEEPTTPPWLRGIAASSPRLTKEERVSMAKNPDTTLPALLALSSSDDVLVRSVLAGRPSLGSELEQALLTDGSADVRVRLALHPQLTERGRDALLGDGSPAVRMAARAGVGGEGQPAAPVLLAHGVVCDVGPERNYNEDAATVVALPGALLALVADGMGGSSSGLVASERTIQAVPRLLSALLSRAAAGERGAALEAAIGGANLEVCELSATNRMYTGIGTTAAAVLIDGERAHIAHVGDSRVSRLRAGKIEALTRDHSLINEYLSAMTDITEQQLAEIPKNVITRAVGYSPDLRVDLREEPLLPGDVFFVCSDGVSEVPEAALREALAVASTDPQQAAAQLVAAGIKSGTTDNVTAVVVVVG